MELDSRVTGPNCDCLFGVFPTEGGLERCDLCETYADDDEARSVFGYALRELLYANADESTTLANVFVSLGIDPRPNVDGKPAGETPHVREALQTLVRRDFDALRPMLPRFATEASWTALETLIMTIDGNAGPFVVGDDETMREIVFEWADGDDW